MNDFAFKTEIPPPPPPVRGNAFTEWPAFSVPTTGIISPMLGISKLSAFHFFDSNCPQKMKSQICPRLFGLNFNLIWPILLAPS